MAVLVQIILIFVGVVYSEIIELPGDVVVSGLFSLKKNVGGKCKDLDFSTIQEAEAVKWTFNKLNSENYINGVKIGFKAYDTCGLTHQALSMAKRHIADSSCDNSAKILGVIGPKQSKEAISVSRLLGSLPSDLQLPQIGYATTSDQLSNREMFSNFFRVIPPNKDQITAVLALLEKLRWTYITIVYDEDLYGLEGVVNIKKSAQQRGICIMKTKSIDKSASSVSIRNEMQTFLVDVSNRGVSGVLVLGSSRTTQLLIETISSYDILRFIMIVAAEYTDPLIEKANTASIRSIFKLQPFMWRYSNFDRHWKNIFKGKMLLKESISNPWLLDVFETITNCRPESGNSSSTSCPLMNDVQIAEELSPSIFTNYAVQSALAMAKSIKTLHENKCQHYSKGPCKDFLSALRSEMISIVKTLVVDFQADFGSYAVGDLFSASSLQLRFSSNGDVEIPELVPSHEIVNWQVCGSGNDSFCYKPVGNFSIGNDELKLNISQVRQYEKDGEEIYWDTFKKAQCPDNDICNECFTDTQTNAFINTTGDMYIIVIVAIHSKSDSQVTCGDIRVSGGYELSEAAFYAIQSARDHNLAIPHADIGVIVIDSCDNDFLIKERILSLHRRGLPLGNGKYVNVNNKILGYVGALGSGISSAAAEILQNFGYVQISYASTSSELSDRNRYPYFLRVTTPDIIQGRVLLQIVRELKSNYVQVIHSAEKYGEDGLNIILDQADEFRVCIAQNLSVEEGNVKQYRDVIQRLKNYPNSRVVILFMRSHIVEGFVKEMDNLISPMEYILLGSEAWGKRDFVHNLNNIEGAITLTSSLPHDRGFLQYMSNIVPLPYQHDSWMLSYFTAILGCYYEWGFNKSSGLVCTGNERLYLTSGYKVDPWSPFLITAMHALLRGAYETLISLCGDSTSICDAYKKQPMTLVDNLKTIQLDYKGQQKITRVFDDNGDGFLGYTIWNVQKDTNVKGKMDYKLAGYAFANGELNLANTNLVYANDVAENSVCNTNECKICTSGTRKSSECPLSSSFYPICGALAAVILILSLIIVYLIKRKYTRPTTGKHINKDEASFKSKSNKELLPVTERKFHSDTSSGYASDFTGSEKGIGFVAKNECPRSTPSWKSRKGSEKSTLSSVSKYRSTSMSSSMGLSNDGFVMDCANLTATKTRINNSLTAVHRQQYQRTNSGGIPARNIDIVQGSTFNEKPVYLHDGKLPRYEDMQVHAKETQSKELDDLPDLRGEVHIQPSNDIMKCKSTGDSAKHPPKNQVNQYSNDPTEQRGKVFTIGSGNSKSESSDVSSKHVLSNNELSSQSSTKTNGQEKRPLPNPPDQKPPPIPTTPF